MALGSEVLGVWLPFAGVAELAEDGGGDERVGLVAGIPLPGVTAPGTGPPPTPALPRPPRALAGGGFTLPGRATATSPPTDSGDCALESS